MTDPHTEYLDANRDDSWFPCREPERPFDDWAVFVAECPACIRAARVVAVAGLEAGYSGMSVWDGKPKFGQSLGEWADQAEEELLRAAR